MRMFSGFRSLEKGREGRKRGREEGGGGGREGGGRRGREEGGREGGVDGEGKIADRIKGK